jgi:hypothetical protein
MEDHRSQVAEGRVKERAWSLPPLASRGSALHFAYYNFCWQVRILKGPTPAMAAGVTDRLWNVSDLVQEC